MQKILNGFYVEKYLDWYNDRSVQYQLTQQMFNKEFAMLKVSFESGNVLSWRNLRCHNTDNFNMFRRILVRRNRSLYNYYTSLETYRTGIPIMLMNDHNRPELSAKWNNRAASEVTQQDVLLDWDAVKFSELEKIKPFVHDVHIYLNQRKIEHCIIYSGMGFHIIIIDAARYWPKDTLATARYVFCGKANCKKNFFDETVFTQRRLRKLPYSLAVYDHGMYVCWPFSSIEEFLNFDYREFEIMKFDKEIYNRGVHIFNKND